MSFMLDAPIPTAATRHELRNSNCPPILYTILILALIYYGSLPMPRYLQVQLYRTVYTYRSTRVAAPAVLRRVGFLLNLSSSRK